MSLKPVLRRSVPDDVFDQIVDDVLSGDLAPGEPLPSERQLAEVLGVSRPAVREALQRLSHAGYIHVRHGESTTILDVRRLGGLDLLPRLLLRAGSIDLSVARSMIEARRQIGPIVARLAAERGGAGLTQALSASIDELCATTDPVAAQRAALAFWDVVVDGAESIAFRLMFNSLRAAYEPTIDALSALMSAEVSQREAYVALADAIAAGDADGARDAAAALLEPATAALLAAIAAIEVGA